MRFTAFTAVAMPELIGVLVWWAAMLGAPVMLIRRWRRRHHTDHQSDALGGEVPGQGAAPLGQGPADLQSVARPPCNRPFAQPGSTRPAVSLAPGTLEPLGRYVDFRRRLELAAAELERRLATLPDEHWRIEPYPLTGERRNTVLVLGTTGVFVISATYPPGSWDDVIAVRGLADKIQMLLPGYTGQVRPAICHPFTGLQPRVWYRADDNGRWVGAWLLGGDSLIHWLGHFGPEQGLGTGDLGHFDALAKVNWLRPAIVAAATWPPLPERGRLRSQE